MREDINVQQGIGPSLILIPLTCTLRLDQALANYHLMFPTFDTYSMSDFCTKVYSFHLQTKENGG